VTVSFGIDNGYGAGRPHAPSREMLAGASMHADLPFPYGPLFHCFAGTSGD